MNLNMKLRMILSILVVIIGLYVIVGLGQHTLINYLAVILFAAVFVLTIKEALNPKK